MTRLRASRFGGASPRDRASRFGGASPRKHAWRFGGASHRDHVAQGDTGVVRVPVWCYRRLLILYPRAFRSMYGSAMQQAFRDRCRDANRHGGVIALVRICAGALVDLVANGIIERVSRDFNDPSPSTRRAPVPAPSPANSR